MKPSKSVFFFILWVFVLPVSAYVTIKLFQNKYEKLPVYKTPSKDNLLNHIGEYHFINQDDKPLGQQDWDNKILVVDFFFTHCLSICPKMTSGINGLSKDFVDDSTIRFASFTVDPNNDSSQQLKKYSLHLGLNMKYWNLITGNKKDIYKLARNAFNVVATDGDGGPEDFIHSDQVVLVDADKNIRGYYDGTKPGDIKKLLHDIKKLKNEN